MLPDFIESNEIKAQILTFDVEVAHSTPAAAIEKTLPVVKTLLLAHAHGYVLAVLEGSKKVDLAAAAGAGKLEALRLALPEEVEEVTGYPVGGVPPISVYGTPTLIDEGVLAHAWVVAGGGDAFSLLKIMSQDIVAHAYEPLVAAIAQKR